MTFVLKISVDPRQPSGDCKQLSDEVFVIFGIIKVSVSVISLSLRLTETLIIPDITKSGSNNCVVYTHRFKENNEKRIMLKKRMNKPCSHFAVRTVASPPVSLTLLLEIVRCLHSNL